MPQNRTDERELKGRHVLAILLVFFGIMFTVNFYFVYVALNTYPGEVVKNPYIQGIEYNQTLDRRAAQATLGWRAQIGLEGHAGDYTLHVKIRDSQASGLDRLQLAAELGRTISDREDRALVFTAQGDGNYLCDIGELAPGKWDVRLRASRPGDDQPVFEAHKTLIVK